MQCSAWYSYQNCFVYLCSSVCVCQLRTVGGFGESHLLQQHMKIAEYNNRKLVVPMRPGLAGESLWMLHMSDEKESSIAWRRCSLLMCSREGRHTLWHLSKSIRVACLALYIRHRHIWNIWHECRCEQDSRTPGIQGEITEDRWRAKAKCWWHILQLWGGG